MAFYLGLIERTDRFPTIPRFSDRDYWMRLVFLRIFEENHSDPTTPWPNIFESILAYPARWSTNPAEINAVTALADLAKQEFRLNLPSQAVPPRCLLYWE